MQNLTKKDRELVIKLKVEELSATQVRLLKNITSLMTNVVVADEEAEFFDTSSELFKKVSELVKHAQFAEANKSINYGEQAIEYSIDNLNEDLETHSIQNLDN